MKISAKATRVAICLNIAKNLVQLHGDDGSRQVVLRRRFSCGEVRGFFEAASGS